MSSQDSEMNGGTNNNNSNPNMNSSREALHQNKLSQDSANSVDSGTSDILAICNARKQTTNKNSDEEVLQQNQSSQDSAGSDMLAIVAFSAKNNATDNNSSSNTEQVQIRHHQQHRRDREDTGGHDGDIDGPRNNNNPKRTDHDPSSSQDSMKDFLMTSLRTKNTKSVNLGRFKSDKRQASKKPNPKPGGNNSDNNEKISNKNPPPLPPGSSTSVGETKQPGTTTTDEEKKRKFLAGTAQFLARTKAAFANKNADASKPQAPVDSSEPQAPKNQPANAEEPVDVEKLLEDLSPYSRTGLHHDPRFFEAQQKHQNNNNQKQPDQVPKKAVPKASAPGGKKSNNNNNKKSKAAAPGKNNSKKPPLPPSASDSHNTDETNSGNSSNNNADSNNNNNNGINANRQKQEDLSKMENFWNLSIGRRFNDALRTETVRGEEKNPVGEAAQNNGDGSNRDNNSNSNDNNNNNNNANNRNTTSSVPKTGYHLELVELAAPNEESTESLRNYDRNNIRARNPNLPGQARKYFEHLHQLQIESTTTTLPLELCENTNSLSQDAAPAMPQSSARARPIARKKTFFECFFEFLMAFFPPRLYCLPTGFRESQVGAELPRDVDCMFQFQPFNGRPGVLQYLHQPLAFKSRITSLLRTNNVCSINWRGFSINKQQSRLGICPAAPLVIDIDLNDYWSDSHAFLVPKRQVVDGNVAAFRIPREFNGPNDELSESTHQTLVGLLRDFRRFMIELQQQEAIARVLLFENFGWCPHVPLYPGRLRWCCRGLKVACSHCWKFVACSCEVIEVVLNAWSASEYYYVGMPQLAPLFFYSFSGRRGIHIHVLDHVIASMRIQRMSGFFSSLLKLDDIQLKLLDGYYNHHSTCETVFGIFERYFGGMFEQYFPAPVDEETKKSAPYLSSIFHNPQLGCLVDYYAMYALQRIAANESDRYTMLMEMRESLFDFETMTLNRENYLKLLSRENATCYKLQVRRFIMLMFLRPRIDDHVSGHVDSPCRLPLMVHDVTGNVCTGFFTVDEVRQFQVSSPPDLTNEDDFRAAVDNAKSWMVEANKKLKKMREEIVKQQKKIL